MNIDTIVATATPLGQSAIGVLRVSGPKALSLISTLLTDKEVPSCWIARHVYRKALTEPQGKTAIDEALITYFDAPRSYTGEDLVEVSTHGNPLIQQTVLRILLEQGARLADPGEFTKRAFLNGKLDLAQAEAVADLISAQSMASLKAAHALLNGKLSESLGQIRSQMVLISAEIEASLEFPDDVNEPDYDQMRDRLEGGFSSLSDILLTWDYGRYINSGAIAVIVGKPNVGKSSLLNALLNRERVLVSSIPGTTRDTIEEQIVLGGVPFTMIDTAGLGDAQGPVEELGMDRTRKAIQKADLILLLLDLSRPLDIDDMRVISLTKPVNSKQLVVLNKKDLPLKWTREDLPSDLREYPCVQTCVLTGQGLPELQGKIAHLFQNSIDSCSSDQPVLTHLRHHQLLTKAASFMHEAKDQCCVTTSDLLAETIIGAIRVLDSVTGENADEEVLHQIFERFCIGK